MDILLGTRGIKKDIISRIKFNERSILVYGWIFLMFNMFGSDYRIIWFHLKALGFSEIFAGLPILLNSISDQVH